MIFRTALLLIFSATITISGCGIVSSRPAASDKTADTGQIMKESLVYLDISSYSYDQFQPWKPADLRQDGGFGCAVGPNQVLTTAWNVADAALIKARFYGQNEFVPAKVRTIDYELNLCLLELDPNAMKTTLKPVSFTEEYKKEAQLDCYWISSDVNLSTSRGILDRAEVRDSTTSYIQYLNYIISSISRQANRGQLYCYQGRAVGIASWSTKEETGIIPAGTILSFLAQAGKDSYAGFGSAGFETENILDPARRARLGMPADLDNGVYVSKIYTLGTGTKDLKEADVILSIEGNKLDAYGRFDHPKFGKISYDYLITSHKAGDEITFEIWRGASVQKLGIRAENFAVWRMLIPYHQYGTPPEYLVTAGFVFQKLTKEYFSLWGEDSSGKSPPHLYHYLRDKAFMPTAERSGLVILSYVMPADINLGYQQLSSLVVKTFNGKPISNITDILDAQKLLPDSKFDIVEFEMDYPPVVIPRRILAESDKVIFQIYGVSKPYNTGI